MDAIINLLRLVKGVFPDVCSACGTRLSNDNMLCLHCMYELPKTDHFILSDNRFTKHFIGRIEIEHGAAYLDFYKEGIVQELMHKLKYRGKFFIGEFLGRMAGRKLNDSLFSKVDIIIPVPLHKLKRHRRGYNQCEAFAKGLSETSKVPYNFDLLIKVKNTSSQTAKSRIERIKNVESSFQLTDVDSLKGKHVLLVDDVITTGATLESCALTLLKACPDLRISMLTIAIANN